MQKISAVQHRIVELEEHNMQINKEEYTKVTAVSR